MFVNTYNIVRIILVHSHMINGIDLSFHVLNGLNAGSCSLSPVQTLVAKFEALSSAIRKICSYESFTRRVSKS